MSMELQTEMLRPYQIGAHGDKPLMLHSTLDPANKADKIALASAMLAYTSILDLAEKPAEIVNYLEWDDVDVDEESGEEKLLHKCGWIARDNTVYYSTGASLSAKMRAFMRLFGPPPWVDGQWFVFGASKSKQGRTFHWFRPVNTPPGMSHQNNSADAS